jgi:TPR repeat protein
MIAVNKHLPRGGTHLSYSFLKVARVFGCFLLFCFLSSNFALAQVVDPCGYGCPKEGCGCPGSGGGPIKSSLAQKKSAQETRDWLLKAAAQSNPGAENNLGVMYELGEGVAVDNQAAIKWYRRAAEHGNADGEYNLGEMYDKGKSVAVDHDAAVKWYKKAEASQGDPFAK